MKCSKQVTITQIMIEFKQVKLLCNMAIIVLTKCSAHQKMIKVSKIVKTNANLKLINLLMIKEL